MLLLQTEISDDADLLNFEELSSSAEDADEGLTSLTQDDLSKSHPRAVLHESQAMEIYRQRKTKSTRLGADSNTVFLAKKYNVSPKTIRDIWNRRTWIQQTRHLWTEDEQPVARKKKQPRSKNHGLPQPGSDYARLQMLYQSPYYFNPHHYIPSAPPPHFDALTFARPQPVLSNTTFAVLRARRQSLPWPGAGNPQHAHGADQHSACARASNHDACNASSAAPPSPTSILSCPSQTPSPPSTIADEEELDAHEGFGEAEPREAPSDARRPSPSEWAGHGEWASYGGDGGGRDGRCGGGCEWGGIGLGEYDSDRGLWDSLPTPAEAPAAPAEDGPFGGDSEDWAGGRPEAGDLLRTDWTLW